MSLDAVPGLCYARDRTTGRIIHQPRNDLVSVMQRDWICDRGRLQKLIGQTLRDPTFYCGIASNMNELLSLFDQVFLLVASPKTIRLRLAMRTNNDFGHDPAVQDWIVGWKDSWEGQVQKNGAVSTNADRPVDRVADEIIQNSKP